MGYQSEAKLEDQLIKKLEGLQYTYKKIYDYKELENNFREQIEKFNSDVLITPLTDAEFSRIINYLCGKTVFVSAKQLRDKFVLERDDNSKVYIRFLSENPEENIYQVTNQVRVSGKYDNRYDVTMLINGLPVVQIELKRSGVDINEAINQINKYKLHSYKGLFHYVQIFVASNSVETRYFSNTDEVRFLKSLTFYWTDEHNNRICNMDDFSSAFLERNRLVKMIYKYMVLSESEKNLMVMRPYQVYATEAVLEKAIETDKGGYIWHTTGSGKTLTSFKCAQLLCREKKVKKVIFLVDRSDLDNKTIEDFNTYEKDCVDMTEHTGVLIKQLKAKDKLIVSTIQKMAKAINNPRYKNDIEHLKDEKIIFIFDECHRSQAGSMHTDIKRFFTNAQYFGFTGTPIFKENKGAGVQVTADLFGKCLHQYLISNAIADKNVLGFSVEYIKTYEGQYDEDDETLVEDIDRKEVLEADERVALVANHIIHNHLGKTRNKKYTAIFATSSIPMLVKYYDAFKEINHSFKIGAVFSYGTNEDLENKEEHSKDQLARIVDDYNKMFDTAFTLDTYAAYNRDIANRLKIKKLPQLDILIVVNMYLTGFDSRPLNTLYVDKNLEWHGLLQAYSRTNRVEKETKQFGNIICYRNLKKKTDRALELFSGGGDVSKVLMKPYDHYVEEFKILLGNLYKIADQPSVLAQMLSEDEKAKFVIAFRELSKMLLIMQTFTEFSWDDLDMYITQQSYEDYKSWYLTFYDEVAKRADAEKVSILADIDFTIELIQVDKINVAYIINLIKNIDLKNKKQKGKDVDNIHKELGRATDPELRKKIDLIKAFLEDVVPTINPDGDIIEAYSDYENEERNKEIDIFVKENNLEKEALKEAISEYEFSEKFEEEKIKKSFPEGLKFMERLKLISKTKDFIRDNCEKYR